MSESCWWELPWAVLDTETTGLNPETGDRIIEIGVVLFDDGEVSDNWGVLIDPERDLPERVTEITNITPADLAGQPTFDKIADKFLSLLEGRILVAYNAEFDRGFLIHELARSGRQLPPSAHWLDPFVVAKKLHKGRGKMKLGIVAERLGIPLQEAHRAVADAECAGLVLKALAEEGNLPADLETFLVLHEQWQAEQYAKQAHWGRPKGPIAVNSSGPSNSLGPGYPHAKELDPIRFMFLRGSTRR